MSDNYKLTYFSLRGRAEPARLLFKLAGKPFDDNRVSGDSWQAFKAVAPKGQLPVLEVNGKMMCESMAIARYVARETGAYGDNNWEAAVIDMFADTTFDIVNNVVLKMYSAKTDEAHEEYKKMIEAGLEGLEKLAVKYKKGRFLLGEKPSLGDVLIHTTLDLCNSTTCFDLDAKLYPKVKEMSEGLANIPVIAEWIKTRPESSV